MKVINMSEIPANKKACHISSTHAKTTYPGNIFLLEVVLVAELGVLICDEVGRSAGKNRFHVFSNVYVLTHKLHTDYPIPGTIQTIQKYHNSITNQLVARCTTRLHK